MNPTLQLCMIQFLHPVSIEWVKAQSIQNYDHHLNVFMSFHYFVNFSDFFKMNIYIL